MANKNIDFITDAILNLGNPFVQNCKKITERRHFPVLLEEQTVILNLQKKKLAVIINLANKTIKTNFKSFVAV